MTALHGILALSAMSSSSPVRLDVFLIRTQVEDIAGKLEPSLLALVTVKKVSIGGLDSVGRD